MPEEVSTGPPDLRQALMAARLGDGQGLSRGEKLARAYQRLHNVEERTHKQAVRAFLVAEFHRCHPGQAPPLCPSEEYCLFPPGVDTRLDLANPGVPLLAGSKSYRISKLRGFTVRVQLGKRCFEILASPPPVKGCLNVINRRGILTVGFGIATDKAWILVLQVLDQVKGPDERPLALAANSVSRASAETPEDEAPEATPEAVVVPGGIKRRLDDDLPDAKSRRVVKHEPDASGATATDHVCIGRELWMDNIKLEGGFVRGEARIVPTADFPQGECSHCPYVVVPSAPGSTPEANPSSSSQCPVVATDAASTNLSQGDRFLAGEGGGDEATSLKEDLPGGGDATTDWEEESDEASAGCNDRHRCLTRSHNCRANIGGEHLGMIRIKKFIFPSVPGEWKAIVCERTGDIMNTPLLAKAFNLDPQKQSELYQLQRYCPEAIPGYETSSDDEWNPHHVRFQPSADAILYDTQSPAGPYSNSCCADALRLWSDAFFMRSVVSAWANHCEYGYHERIVDPAIPPRHSAVREYRFARARVERALYRENCIRAFKHHARLREFPILRISDGGAAAGPRASAGVEQWLEVPGFGGDVYSNDLAQFPSTAALAIDDVGGAAHASCILQLAQLQQELFDAIAAASAAATSSSERTSAAGAVSRAATRFSMFCEYVKLMAIGVLKDDEDGNAV